MAARGRPRSRGTPATSASAVDDGVELPGAGGLCVFKVLPNPVPNGFPAQVHIEGTAPAGSTVIAFAGETQLVSAVTDGSGVFKSTDFTLNAETDVTANYFEPRERLRDRLRRPRGLVGRPGTHRQPRKPRQQLAFTGSNNTHSFVLIGVAALIVGLVLTVSARPTRQDHEA